MAVSAIGRMQGREPSIREYLACIVLEVVVQRSSELKARASGRSGLKYCRQDFVRTVCALVRRHGDAETRKMK
jgi:hypothetical protein